MSMEHGGELDGPKGELLHLLARVKHELGLTDPVIRAMVQGSEITYPGRRLPLVVWNRPTRHVRFVVQGVAKIVCQVPRRRPVLLDLVGKGEFLCLPPPRIAQPSYRLEAGVHEGPVVLALIPRGLVARAISELPPTNAAQLVSWGWRNAFRLAYAKSALLALPTDDRLRLELARLAERFGRRTDEGWILISVRLLEEDLASLIVRSRSNVSRAFTRLREARLVDRTGGRILVATALLGSLGSIPGDPHDRHLAFSSGGDTDGHSLARVSLPDLPSGTDYPPAGVLEITGPGANGEEARADGSHE